MAEAVAGCEVDLLNTNDGRFDITEFPRYDCAAFGSPDYGSCVAGNLKQFMDDHYIADVRKGMQGIKGKPYALFCSHAGGGRVKDVMPRLFRRIGTQVGELVASQRAPSPQVLDQCKALGRQLGQSVS